MINRFLVLLTGLFFIAGCSSVRSVAPSLATSGENAAYNIEITITGEKNKNIVLGRYTGTDTYPADTVATDENGKAAFSGNKSLAPGMYTIITGKKHTFDFLVSDTINQFFSISATKDKYSETLSFKNSPENETFIAYSRFIVNKQKREKELINSAKNGNSLPSANAEIESMTRQADVMESEIKAKFPGSLLEPVASAMNPVHPKTDDILNVSDKQGYVNVFYRKHYWDKLTLTDRRMTNTPILVSSIDNYFDNIVVPIPDSVIHSVDFVLSKAANDTAMTKFLTNYIFDKYLRHIDGSGDSYIMGMENVVVHIIDNYYLADKVNIKNEKYLKEITDYANKNRESLIGKKAKELKMETVNGDAESLYDIDSPYILVCFFDALCSHCQKEIPAIYKIFRKYRNRGLAGFCVYTYNNKKEWTEFVAKNQLTDWINVWDPENENDFRIAYSIYSVPQVYLLDKNKNIIGRGLESESLAQLLNRLIK
jgi:peroxiredoxin